MLNMNCVNMAVTSVFWSAYLIIRLQWQCLSRSRSPTVFYLLLLNYLRKICNQTTPSPQPTSSHGDTVRPLMSENSNSCSHKSPRPSELVSHCPMGNVVLFPLYIDMFVSNCFGLLREALWFIWLEKSPYLSGAKERFEAWGSLGNRGVWPQKQA